MKKSILLLLILTILSPLKISGQKTIEDLNNKWSAAISFSPITTFYYYHGSHNEYNSYNSKGIEELIYPIGLNFELTRQLNERLSINTGLNFKARLSDNIINVISEWAGSYYEESTDNRYIFEMPVNFKYQLISSPRVFNPYLKTGLRGSYFKRYYVGEYTRWRFDSTTNGEINNHDGKLIIFYQIGAGTYINLFKSLTFNVGSNLAYTLSGFGYLELQVGLNYSFK
jgi:hypothetical protein